MSIIQKSLWTRKKQNGWIFAEIAIISCLSWFIVDFLTVTFYATHFCIPAGEFEKDHLCVGQLGIVRSESASEGQDITEEEARGVYVIRDKLATMPEVASVCLTPDYLGANLRFYNWRTLAWPMTPRVPSASRSSSTTRTNISSRPRGYAPLRAVPMPRRCHGRLRPTASS